MATTTMKTTNPKGQDELLKGKRSTEHLWQFCHSDGISALYAAKVRPTAAFFPCRAQGSDPSRREKWGEAVPVGMVRSFPTTHLRYSKEARPWRRTCSTMVEMTALLQPVLSRPTNIQFVIPNLAGLTRQ